MSGVFDVWLKGISAVLLASVSVGIALAQEVSLTSDDGVVSISGRLLAFEDGVYLVETSIGTLSVRADRVTCIGDACPEPSQQGLVPVLVNARIGAHVSLSSEENVVQVSGKLLHFEDQTYTIETKVGPFSLPAAGTRCTGDGCPEEVWVPLSHLAPRLQERQIN